MKHTRSLKQNHNGQVLIVTSLVVVLLLLSTVVYVEETTKNAPVSLPDNSSIFAAIKQAAEQTLVSALANASAGGNPAVLQSNLARFQEAVESHAYDATSQLSYTPSTVSPYLEGFLIAWGTNGHGVSRVRRHPGDD